MYTKNHQDKFRAAMENACGCEEDAPSPRKDSTADQVFEMLSIHRESEGAVATLQRIIRERDDLRKRVEIIRQVL